MNNSLLFVSCATNLEPLLKNELNSLGITDLRLGYRGIYAPNTLENIFKINYLSRIATRVLLPLAQFACPDTETLYNEVKKIPWLDYLDETKTLSIDANINHPQIRHSLYGAQLVKDAICDAIREKKDARPSVDTKNPDVQLNIFIQNKRATLSFDTSGSPLYKRGWKEQSGEASLPETLAAAILMRANYSEKEILCDPFCGSGTFLIEAASMATKTPSGYFRKKWGFTHLPFFKEEEWTAVKNKLDSRIVPLKPYSIFGGDRDRKAIDLCKATQKNTHIPVHFQHNHIHNFKPLLQPTLVIANPPYGTRIQAPADPYLALAEFLKTTCHSKARAAILSPHRSLPPVFGRQTKKPIPLLNGGLEIYLHLVS